MKLLANLILTASIILGALAASTAYIAPLSLPDEQLVGLTITQPAGRVAQPDGSYEPLIPDHTALTAEHIQALRDHRYDARGVEREVRFVTVNDFDFNRWIGRWPFLAAMGGLALGAWLMRRATKSELTRSEPAPGAAVTASPEELLGTIITTVESLRRDLPGLADDRAREQAVLERIGEVQSTHAPAFIDARTRLVARLGLGGYAELMDRFAAAERQINRAWSAAADHAMYESMPALDTAAGLLAEARPLLNPR